MEWIQDGTRINGIYCDVRFSGVVKSSRGHSVSGEQILNIEIDAPIMVYGVKREHLNECPITMFKDLAIDGTIDLTPPPGARIYLPKKSARPASGVTIKTAKNRSFLALIIGADIQARTGLQRGDRVALAQLNEGAAHPWYLVKDDRGFSLYHDGASPTLRATLTGMRLTAGDVSADCSARAVSFPAGSLQIKGS